MILDVEFPITDGAVSAALRTNLNAAWGAGLKVGRKLPANTAEDPFTRRMITVRNDAGPEEGVLSRRRYGVNVWADNSLDAERIALDSMTILRMLPRISDVVKATDSFSGPYEVEDDPRYVVNSKNLTHFYFSFRLTAKGSNPS